MSRTWLRSAFWIGGLLLVAIFMWLLSGIMLPFVAGLAIAFFLDPMADRLERLRLPRSVAAFIVLLVFFMAVIAALVLLVPLIQAQVTQFIAQLPTYVQAVTAQANRLIDILNEQLNPDDVAKLREAASARAGDALSALGKVLTSVVTGGVAVANILSLVFITPIVAFFMLRDWDRLVARIDSWLPRQHLHTIREQALLIEETLSGFLRGQAMVCALLGIFYGLALTVIGLNFGLVIGLFTGFLIFIPFLGGLTGAVLSVGLAFAQFGDWHRPAVVAAVFVVGQGLEGNVLTPKLVGDSVHLHPVWIIFALLAFGALFGFVGVLLAVPLAAVIGVLMRFALKQYLTSPLYDPRYDSAPVLTEVSVKRLP
ncbi:MAG TPA: AI-2E family transporter [Stellaceae bacterium]|nr:AI-2E family transporter [Stellaceae bacterium]